MAKTQADRKVAAPAAPEIVKTTAAVKAPKLPPKGTRQVAAGAVSGPKGRRLQDNVVEEVAEVSEEQRHGERRQAESDAVMQFTNAQLSSPAAHLPELTAQQKKMAEFKEAQAKLAKEMGVELEPEVEVPVVVPKNAKLQRNNVTRPADNTKTGLVWRTADAISAAQNGNPATIAQMKEHKDMKEMNDFTLKTQYARWRSYNGIKGRAAAPAARVTPEGDYPGVPLVK